MLVAKAMFCVLYLLSNHAVCAAMTVWRKKLLPAIALGSKQRSPAVKNKQTNKQTLQYLIWQ